MNVSEWPLYRYRATVTRIVDGDTVRVSCQLGMYVSREVSIRLLGYDAPELFSGTDRAAGARARDALARIIPVGSTVYVATRLDRTSFDRLLGTVFVEGSDGELHDVAELMIAGGLARYHTS